ncbi:MAG: 2-phosphosulfolactate phosphatase [Propionibacteriaceae bacterium]|nr:2-phosphosulfolactate phosphatase [Micropruina sp.]HBX80375.1 hypothetical protein [Propionibacteriaceae bacterium]HBY24531.1 hypothetical protein [Propionibacteriaceae bacterium]
MPIDIRHSREISAEERLQDAYDLAVVIDVIRAFTVAPWILRQGAARLLLSPDKATALQAKAGNFPEAVLVSDGAPDARFELPNAPGQVAHHDLTGRVVIQTTGNGTRGAHLVRHVPTVASAGASTTRLPSPTTVNTACGQVLGVAHGRDSAAAQGSRCSDSGPWRLLRSVTSSRTTADR